MSCKKDQIRSKPPSDAVPALVTGRAEGDFSETLGASRPGNYVHVDACVRQLDESSKNEVEVVQGKSDLRGSAHVRLRPSAMNRCIWPLEGLQRDRAPNTPGDLS